MGTDEHPEDLALRAVPENAGDDAPIDDGLLLAYRAGQLSPEVAEEVEARLARDPQARALLVELSRPLDPELVNRLEAASGVSRRRAAPWIGAALAVAAAAIVFAAIRPVDDVWPAYTMEVEGFIAKTRGDHAPREHVMDIDSALTIRLRPDRSPGRASSFGVWLAREDQPLMAIRGGSLKTYDGALSWSAEAYELFDAPGHYLVAVALFEGDAPPPGIVGMTLEAAKREHPGVEWWTVEVEFRSPAG